ncbi:MAG: PAS domain S-box protein [Prolixibacteraceae bacterium]|nr:PAS domain S-box protein [Prolixibacteraceae bacterium]MBN2773485.1 PAS domain S-box protein [Prolixibacteraceae bacterium]
MLDLCPIKDKNKVLSIFNEKVKSLFKNISIEYVSGQKPNEKFKYELKSGSDFYGTIVFNNEYKKLTEENKYYLNSSCSLLTVILEKIANEELLKSDKKALESITKKQNTEIKESEAKFMELYENTPVALFRSTVEGHVLEVNMEMVRMYGFDSKEDLLNRPAVDYYTDPGDREKIIGLLQKTGEALNIISKETKKDGSLLWVKSNYRATFDPENPTKIKHIDGAAIDITASKDYEHELNSYRDELEERVKKRTNEIENQSVKLKESQKALTFLLADVNESRKELENVVKELAEVNKDLESFSYSVSHDLRAPLRAINGFTQILKEDYYNVLDDEGKRIMNVIISNVNSMTQLIDDLLAFTRIGRKVLVKNIINTNNFIRTIADELISPLQKKPAIIIDELPEILGDLNLLKQVFINLISNAIKFTGTVPEPAIKISGKEESKIVQITIEDNGIGFDNKYGEKIFEVFQRLHTVNEYEGAGVGLSIVKKIVEKHDGKIIAYGTPGKGARFTIHLKK